MSISPVLDIYSVTIMKIMLNSMSVPILINCDESKETVETLGLLDSGAGGEFIDQNYAKRAGFEIKKLNKPLQALNVDRTKNKRGTITSFVELNAEINKKQMNLCLLVTGLGKQKIILSFPWLHEHNPEINWKTGDFTWREIKIHQDQKMPHMQTPAISKKNWQDRHLIKLKKRPMKKKGRIRRGIQCLKERTF